MLFFNPLTSILTIDNTPARPYIKDTDKNGSCAYTYFTKLETEAVWDYRNYNLKFDNALLKGKIAQIAEGYSAFEAYLDFA